MMRKKANQSVNIDVPITKYCTFHFVIVAFVYNDDHINYVVTVQRSKLHIKKLKTITKFNTQFALKIAKFNICEIWPLI